ncbi:MAG: methyltransferase domain-containing protein [Myxococcota bacterium]
MQAERLIAKTAPEDPRAKAAAKRPTAARRRARAPASKPATAPVEAQAPLGANALVAQLTEWAALGYHGLRSTLFFAESLPLLWPQRPGVRRRPTRAKHDDAEAATGRRPRRATAPRAPSRAEVETVLARLRALFEHDARQIARGVIPLATLAPRDPLGHGRSFLRILGDTPSVASRRKRRDARDFGREARGWLDELPAYYRRNFHYQTDGYLSPRSAELYEHQVELLFRGGADAMRRLVVPPLRRHFGSDHDGRGLRLLELGSGTGSATHAVARALPRAKLTCVDLSFPYTRHARRALAAYERVECIQGDAANLDFGAARFDAVYSVFLFHELPLPVREQVLAEAWRVLRPGGFFGLVDSLQRGDDPALDWALGFFPREFHEPYYAHYATHAMEPLVRAAGFERLERGTGYLAKWISAVRGALNPPDTPG